MGLGSLAVAPAVDVPGLRKAFIHQAAQDNLNFPFAGFSILVNLGPRKANYGYAMLGKIPISCLVPLGLFLCLFMEIVPVTLDNKTPHEAVTVGCKQEVSAIRPYLGLNLKPCLEILLWYLVGARRIFPHDGFVTIVGEKYFLEKHFFYGALAFTSALVPGIPNRVGLCCDFPVSGNQVLVLYLVEQQAIDPSSEISAKPFV
jgi:hypothetical protein